MKRTPPNTPSVSNLQHGKLEAENTTPSNEEQGKGKTRTKRPRPSEFSPGQEFRQFSDEMRQTLNTFKVDQEVILNKMVSEMSEIKLQNLELQKTVFEMEKSFEFFNKSYEEMKGKIQDLEQEGKNYREQVCTLENKIEEFHRIARTSFIEIRNIPMAPKESKDDLLNIFQKVCKSVGTDIVNADVHDIYRTKAKVGSSGSIVVDLGKQILKQKIIQSVKQYNTTNKHNKINTTTLGIPGAPQQVYVSENLTNKNRRLLFLARDLVKVHNYAYCWTSNGRVFLRRMEGAPQILIQSEEQLEELKKNK